MTDYPYDMDLVVDPNNPANVVANGLVYIYDPADTAGTTPLALKDPSGLPLPNPLMSNAHGFLPPRIAAVPQSMWKSGGFTGYFNSFVGLRNEALAAKAAAEDAASLVGAPADAAVAAAVAGANTATKGALNAAMAATVPPLVVTALATDPTPANAAAAAVSAKLGEAGVLSGAYPLLEDDTLAFTIIGSSGKRSWVEIDAATGGPSDHAVDLIRAKMATPTPIDTVDVVYTVTGSDGRRSWLEIGPSGGPTQHAVDMLTAAGVGVADGGVTEAKLAPSVASRIPQTKVIDTAVIPGRGLLARDSAGNVFPFVSRADVLYFPGDSLTQGHPKPPFAVDQSDAWPAVLDGLYANGTVVNLGVAGQTADEIALRQGGYILNLSVVGGSIPASGAVGVTTTQVFGWRVEYGWSCPGILAGVPGTVSRGTGTTALTFTRTTAGSAVPVAGAVPFVSDQAEACKTQFQAWMIGRNDVGYASPAGSVQNRIIAANVAMAEAQTAKHPRFLVLGTTTATSEGKGSTNHTDVTASNGTLAKLFPENFLDIRAYLVNQCIYDLGITPTADDLVKMASDTLPPSIMVSGDAIHYSPAAAAKVALQVYNKLSSKGWLL